MKLLKEWVALSIIVGSIVIAVVVFWFVVNKSFFSRKSPNHPHLYIDSTILFDNHLTLKQTYETFIRQHIFQQHIFQECSFPFSIQNIYCLLYPTRIGAREQQKNPQSFKRLWEKKMLTIDFSTSIIMIFGIRSYLETKSLQYDLHFIPTDEKKKWKLFEWNILIQSDSLNLDLPNDDWNRNQFEKVQTWISSLRQDLDSHH